jgi:hypothetical protein
MFFFQSKIIFFTNIKTNKFFQNGVNFILLIKCLVLMTRKELLGQSIVAVVLVEVVLSSPSCYEPSVVVII